MAIGDPQETEFMKQYMKALKFEYEHATTPVAKQQAASKADALRQNAKSMGIDLSAYGEGVRLADTPGGNNINWNILSSVGKAWSGLNPTDDVSKWKQSVGSGLVSNLAGYQGDFASFADSAAYDTKITGKAKPATPVTQFSNVGQAVTVPGVVTPPASAEVTGATVQETPAGQPTVGQAADVVRGGARSSGTQAVTEPVVYDEDTNPDVVDATNGMTSNTDMLAAFFADNPDVAEKDYTLWDTPTLNRFKNWADLQIQKTSAQAIIDQGANYDPTKDPLWNAYEPLLVARDNATKASLKTALDLKINAINQQAANVDANYKFQIAEIENALNMANWASGQQLAASGVIMVGALSQALQSNEAQGINKIWLSVQERTNGLNKLAEDINILTQDYADQGTLIDKARIAEIATERLELLQGNSKEVQAAKLLIAGLNAQIAATNIMAPATQRAEETAAAQSAAQANFETAKALAELDKKGIWLRQDADGNWMWQTGLTDAEQTERDSALFDQWYKTEGLKIDWQKLTDAQKQQAFANWATTQGLNLDARKLDLEWAQLVEANRHNQVTEGIDQQNANAKGAAAGSYMTDDAGFKADMQIANNPKEVGTNNYQQAVLRIGLGSGGLLNTDEAFTLAMKGVAKGKTPAWLANIIGVTVSGGVSGVLQVADEATVAALADITDEKSPARALELYVAWKLAHPPTGSTPVSAKTLNGMVTSYCKDLGAALGYGAADISSATTWLIANYGKLTGAS